MQPPPGLLSRQRAPVQISAPIKQVFFASYVTGTPLRIVGQSDMTATMSFGSSADTNSVIDPDAIRSNLKNYTARCRNIEPSAISKNAHMFAPSSSTESDSLDGFTSNNSDMAQDCYEEIDERMSRNSFEYPEQQAKYVGRWLDDATNASRTRSAGSYHERGNVIGIRGFSSEETRKSESRRERSAYAKLNLEHAKLKTEFDKLQKQFNYTMGKLRHMDIASDNKAATRDDNGSRFELASIKCECQQRQQASRACAGLESEVERLKQELAQLERKLDSKDEEHAKILAALRVENERIWSESETTKGNLSKQLDSLRAQFQSMSSDPNNKLLMTLRNENSRLKDLGEVDMLEFENMKENYRQLEAQLISLIEEQKCSDKEKDEENARLMTELCRLQVYQPKLEMILETERSIKAELQKKIQALQVERSKIQEQLDGESLELRNERMRSKKTESVEIERLQRELAKWQENFYRLTRDKSDVENLLRVSRSKVTQIDAKHQSEMQLVEEAKRVEIERTEQDNLRLEKENKQLAARVGELENRLRDNEQENEKLMIDIKELQAKLVAQEPGDSTLRQAKINEQKLVDLERELKMSEAKKGELTDLCDRLAMQLEQSKKQIEQLNQRCHLQQRACDELREKKDQELAKLRVNLNFEQYNRQVALRGVEKELRASLKELDAVKYRLSRRLAPGQASARQETAATNRVRFCDPPCSGVQVSDSPARHCSGGDTT